MKKQGANKGATTAFLISTPESGVDSIAITYALLDPIMTVVRPVAAFLTAISAGLVENVIDWKGGRAKAQAPVIPMAGTDCCDGSASDEKQKESLRTKILVGLQYAVKDVWADIVVWFFIGLVIAAFITALIPDAWMENYLGGGMMSMGIMLIVGIPLYICATASTPVAAALILKGVSPGAALVFLLVGPATNVTSLSVLFGILGKKSTFRYLAVLSIAAVLFGLGVDYIYTSLNISPQAVLGEAGEVVPYPVKLVATLLLVSISFRPLKDRVQRLRAKKGKETHIVSNLPDLRGSGGAVHFNSSCPLSGCDCNHHDSVEKDRQKT